MAQSKQKVLITGGGSGIGRSLAQKFLEHGHIVIITGRNLAKLEQVKAELPLINIIQSDITVQEEVKKLVVQTQQEFGGIDILVNNAGIMNLLDAANEANELQIQFNEIEINYHAPI
jgi:uncharacterized oxidoreductase